MRKIYLTLIILLFAMVGMVYLYFSRLNRESAYNEISLFAATANSGLVFCIHNDKSVFEILKGQDLFQQLLGEKKFSQLSLLKNKIIANPSINNLIANRNIYISFLGGEDKQIDYLISTQLNDEQDKTAFMEALRNSGIKVAPIGNLVKLTLNDSTAFFAGIKKNLLLLSGAPAPVTAAIDLNSSRDNKEFISYIKLNNKFNSNSVGNMFVDFNKVPALVQSILSRPINGNLAMLSQQNSFVALNYNFGKERLFFNGSSKINSATNYLNLFSSLAPQKNSIDNLLPDHTASYSLFCIPDYKTWRKSLDRWFLLRKENIAVKKILANTDHTYHLDPEKIFPEYFKNQLITFQLKSSESMGAINLSNGDKVKQLLLDISEDYDQDIKVFKVPEFLYCYFGEPFKKFRQPYYIIIDNYMVFANQPAALHAFLRSYSRNDLLVNTSDYINLYTQISNTATVTYYVNHDNSSDLVKNNVYRPFYNHFMAKNGLAKFTSLLYQLSGDKGLFQTNLLLNTMPEIIDESSSSKPQ